MNPSPSAPFPARIALAIFGMSRPIQQLSVLLVYVLGILIARWRGSELALLPIVWGGAALLLVSIAINVINEYIDYETDTLTARTSFSGGSGVLPRGLIEPRTALQAAWVMMIAGIGVSLIGIGISVLNSRILPVVLFGAVFGWLYSAPPLKLAWHGWGEFTNALLGAIVLPFYGYVVVAGDYEPLVLLACLPFALVDFLNLLATHYADRKADQQVGKRTLATRLPIPVLRALYFMVGALAIALLLAFRPPVMPPGVVLLSLISLTILLPYAWLRYTRQESPTPSVLAMVVLLIVQVIGFGLAVQ